MAVVLISNVLQPVRMPCSALSPSGLYYCYHSNRPLDARLVMHGLLTHVPSTAPMLRRSTLRYSLKWKHQDIIGVSRGPAHAPRTKSYDSQHHRSWYRHLRPSYVTPQSNRHALPFRVRLSLWNSSQTSSTSLTRARTEASASSARSPAAIFDDPQTVRDQEGPIASVQTRGWLPSLKRKLKKR